MIYQGKAKRLDDIDLPRVGHLIGVGEDEIHAVLDVESKGTGFDSKGRLVALFEPHVFYRELGKGGLRDHAVREGLAYASWGAKPYPKDSYPRIDLAMAIHYEAALRSTSWGLCQMMGFNCVAAGYATAHDMVQAFADDEENQLNGMIRFIIKSGLDDELRRHDWAGFARGYNGAGFSKNRYDRKLAAAFAKWQKIRDTPFDPSKDQTPPKKAPTEAVTPVQAPMPAPTPSSTPLPAPSAPAEQSKPNWFVKILGTLFGGKKDPSS